MKMVPYDMKQLNYKPTKNLKILEEFMNGDADCVQLVDHGHKDAKCAQSCLRSSIVRFGYADRLAVVIRGDNVFLVKKMLIV